MSIISSGIAIVFCIFITLVAFMFLIDSDEGFEMGLLFDISYVIIFILFLLTKFIGLDFFSGIFGKIIVYSTYTVSPLYFIHKLFKGCFPGIISLGLIVFCLYFFEPSNVYVCFFITLTGFVNFWFISLATNHHSANQNH